MIRIEHLSNGRIWITRAKGGRSGEYPIHPHTRRLLWTYLSERAADGNPFLFVSREKKGGRPISEPLTYHLFRTYARLANLPPDRQHPHVLRHSIAVHLMNAGWDVADVQDWLGHRDIASTMVYAMVTNKRREAKYEESLLSKEIAENDSNSLLYPKTSTRRILRRSSSGAPRRLECTREVDSRYVSSGRVFSKLSETPLRQK